MRWLVPSIHRMTVACMLAACTSHPAATVGVVAASQVTVYRSPTQVGGPYREVAVLTPGRDFPAGTPNVDQLRARAAALGANGIILDATVAPPVSAHAPEYLLSPMPPPAQRTVAILTGGSALAELARR